MAMAVRAQQALHSVASLPSCSSSSSMPSASAPTSYSSDSMASVLSFRPSSPSALGAIACSGGLVQPVSRGLYGSSFRVETIVKGSSRSRRQSGRSGGSLVGCRASYVGGRGALPPDLKAALDNFVGSHKVVLFMKGNRNFPQCGFSNTCIQILNQCQVPYETVNILEDDSLRQGVKEYSNWPTYPQLYVDGEFYGGCDIALEAFKSGELKEALDKAMVS